MSISSKVFREGGIITLFNLQRGNFHNLIICLSIVHPPQQIGCSCQCWRPTPTRRSGSSPSWGRSRWAGHSTVAPRRCWRSVSGSRPGTNKKDLNSNSVWSRYWASCKKLQSLVTQSSGNWWNQCCLKNQETVKCKIYRITQDANAKNQWKWGIQESMTKFSRQKTWKNRVKNIHTEDFFEDYIHLHFCTIARVAHLVDSWLWKENWTTKGLTFEIDEKLKLTPRKFKIMILT